MTIDLGEVAASAAAEEDDVMGDILFVARVVSDVRTDEGVVNKDVVVARQSSKCRRVVLESADQDAPTWTVDREIAGTFASEDLLFGSIFAEQFTSQVHIRVAPFPPVACTSSPPSCVVESLILHLAIGYRFHLIPPLQHPRTTQAWLSESMIVFTPLTGSAATPGPSLSTGPVSYLLELDDVKILLDLGGNDPRRTSEEGYDSTYERKVKEYVLGLQFRWYWLELDYTRSMHANLLQIYRLSPHIDLVLLSHSPTSYTSLYPYARTHWGLKCPVYGTQPTVEVGRLGCLEEAVGWRNEVDVDGLHGHNKEDEDVDGDDHNKDNNDELGDARGREQEEKALKGPYVCTAEEINEAFDHIKAVRYSQPIHLSGKSLVTCIANPHSLQRLN
jgi:hypothetical protein